MGKYELKYEAYHCSNWSGVRLERWKVDCFERRKVDRLERQKVTRTDIRDK